MLKSLFLAAFATLAMTAAMSAQAAVEIGKPAPDFTAKDSNGVEHKLSDFAGKVVVLEWNNPECPYVVKHYDSGNMQKLQEKYTKQDVVWLTINSGKEGKQGHLDAAGANALIEKEKSKQTAYLLDGEGTIGKAYDAKVTPHMFVINSNGVLVYDGAIDDNDSSKAEDALTAKNYVAAAVDATLDGKPVETTKTKPYGCGVKY
jgi:peroxiredoxin